MFLVVTCRDLPEHLINWYRNITTSDLEVKNLEKRKPIDSLIAIGMYFERIDDCIQHVDK